jgi:murein DD-endopeptidase
MLSACTSVPASAVPPFSVPGAAPIVVPRMPRMETPLRSAGFSPGSEIVVRAIALLGTPYLFGGNGPDAFDCSGLVRYVHQGLGIDVPRTAAEQYRAATAVELEQLEPGDLLFFRTRGAGVSHVAIYAGSGRFVHAPQTGRSIELRELDDVYFRPRLVGAGRLF